MDRRKLQRVILCAGILPVTLALGFLLLRGAWKTVYQEDARKLGALSEEYPEEEAALAAVFNGKVPNTVTASDAGTSFSEGSATSGKEDSLSEGLRLFDKYGYTLSDSLRSGTMWRYALSGAAVLTGATVLTILLPENEL